MNDGRRDDGLADSIKLTAGDIIKIDGGYRQDHFRLRIFPVAPDRNERWLGCRGQRIAATVTTRVAGR
jgi:hypothetical protein